MKNKGILTLKVFFLIITTDIVESVAELFYKKAVLSTGIENVLFSNLAEFAGGIVSSPWTWLGVMLYTVNFFIWIVVLVRVDLSLAFPVGSTTYIMVPLLAMIFLHEKVNPMRWFGIIFIIAGIYFISISGEKPKEALK